MPRNRGASMLVRASALAGVLLLAGLAAARPAYAQEPTPAPAVGDAVTTFGAWDWLNLGLRLGLVVVAIWAAFWAMRWYVRRVNGGAAGSGRLLQIVETRTLGPNRSLQLVRLGNRAVLLGVTPDRINQLLTLDDPDEVERLTEASRAPAELPRSVEALVGRLGSALPRFGKALIGWSPPPRPRAEVQSTAPPPAAPPTPHAGFEAIRLDPMADEPDRDVSAEISALAAQRLQAAGSYRRAQIAELQRAIERAREGTSLERRDRLWGRDSREGLR
ncbi:MAG: flagellar biosynthetic protein FliO [Dehalococcoidia bacterium]